MRLKLITLTLMAFMNQFTYAYGQEIFKKYSSKDTLVSNIENLIKEFDSFIKEKGVNPPYVPSFEIKTTNSLIYWDNYKKEIVLPFWDELYPEQKEVFTNWQGENAEQFFTAMFNWFFIPHELGHFITSLSSDNTLKPYKSEWVANKFAVAFLISQKENHRKIEFIENSLEEVLNLLPEVDLGDMTEEEYFDANYDGLGVDPNVYAYFQFKIILDILKTRDEIKIQNYLNSVK